MDINTPSILPLSVVSEKNYIVEKIIADSISGQKDYLDEMPRRLSLIRIFADGKAIQAEYLQQQKGSPCSVILTFDIDSQFTSGENWKLREKIETGLLTVPNILFDGHETTVTDFSIFLQNVTDFQAVIKKVKEAYEKPFKMLVLVE